MEIKDTIIFCGSSNTFGLGMEWELDAELNSEEYLSKGVKLPILRNDYYYDTYWRPNRWSSILCNLTGYNQYNIHDRENQLRIGGNSFETVWNFFVKDTISKFLFPKVKYVILEIPYIRWYDEALHGGPEGYKYPNTVLEMIELLNNPKSDSHIVSKTLNWLHDVDYITHNIEFYKKLNGLISKHSDIHFLILPWHTNAENIETDGKIAKTNIIPIIETGINYHCVNTFLIQNKLHVWNKAKAWNGTYTFNYKDDHASVEGHRRIANIVYNYISKIENKNI